MTPRFEREWREVGIYFALVGVLTLPFWFAGAMVQATLMPGLSVAAFAVVVPTVSAVIVAAKFGGGDVAVRFLFASLGRAGRHMPLVGLAAVVVPVTVAVVSWSLSNPTERAFAAPATLLALTPVFLITAAAEEIGWSAFATERLAGKAGVLAAGLIIGVAWALWHFPTLIELGRSADWIAWWSVWTVAQRVIMVHLHVRGGNWIWGPILFHTASNIAWQAAPDAFDPRVEGVVMATIAVAVWLAFARSNRAA